MYHFTGLGVTFAIASSNCCVLAGLLCPSAINTPSLPTTNRLTVGIPDGCRPSKPYTLSASLVTRGKSVTLNPRLAGSAVRVCAAADTATSEAITQPETRARMTLNGTTQVAYGSSALGP